jgi:hypothetical protein
MIWGVQLFCKPIEELNKLVYLGKEYKDIVIFHKKTKIHRRGECVWGDQRDKDFILKGACCVLCVVCALCVVY